jgi:hypothetical protein
LPDDKQQREHKQQQLAARLAQLPSSNGHSKADSTQQQQEQPQIPQQPTDADAVQAWQLRHDELTQLQQKGRAGGWLISTDEVSRACMTQHITARHSTAAMSAHIGVAHSRRQLLRFSVSEQQLSSCEPSTLGLCCATVCVLQIQLQDVLGKGAFGTTFRANWRGAEVRQA